MSELELCLDFVCFLMCDKSPSFLLQELLHGFFARRQIEFFENNLWVNQTQKIDFQKCFPAIQL